MKVYMLPKQIFIKKLRSVFFMSMFLLLFSPGVVRPQPGTTQAITSAGQFEDLFKEKTMEAVLAKLQPAATKEQIVSSDYLLLGSPDIALAGPIPIRMMSEIPGTDLFLLFDAAPHPEQPALLAVKAIPVLSKADTTVSVNLKSATQLILLARANGKLYRVTRDIKLALKERK